MAQCQVAELDAEVMWQSAVESGLLASSRRLREVLIDPGGG